MAVNEVSGFLKYKGTNGDLNLFYPITTKDNVDGMDAIDEHVASTANPHKVTAAQVGLGNVNNTSDANKPVSTAQAIAIADAKKAGTDAQTNLTSHVNNKSNPHGVTLSQLGVNATAAELNYMDGVTSSVQTQLNGKETAGAAATALSQAKAYTDTEISSLINSAPTTLDTLGEIATAMQENADVVEALESAIGTKAAASDLTSHINNTTAHITSTERTNWNAAKTHADSAHAPSNAEKNQNAFSNVVVGSTTITADTATDTLTLIAGSNVTITPDATNDKITIAATDTVYTHPTSSGNKHIPSGGSSGQILRWSADGTAAWGADNNTTYSEATTSAAGLMSAADKSKLNGIAAGANAYTHPTYTSKSSGLYKITVDGTGHVSGATAVAKSDITALGIPAQDTTYSAATTSAAGLMSATDKSNLDNHVVNKSNPHGVTAAQIGAATTDHTHPEQVSFHGITTAGDGANYTATVEGITALTAGTSFIMIPHVTSTAAMPKLNVNGLGAKNIRRRVSNSTVTTVAASSADWLYVNKPIRMTFDGTYWIADLDRPNAADIYGTMPVTSGGTGATTAEAALANLGGVTEARVIELINNALGVIENGSY